MAASGFPEGVTLGSFTFLRGGDYCMEYQGTQVSLQLGHGMDLPQESCEDTCSLSASNTLDGCYWSGFYLMGCRWGWGEGGETFSSSTPPPGFGE